MNNWIEIGNAIPRDKMGVLIYCAGNMCQYTAYLQDGKWYYFDGRSGKKVSEYANITHWKFLDKNPL